MPPVPIRAIEDGEEGEGEVAEISLGPPLPLALGSVSNRALKPEEVKPQKLILPADCDFQSCRDLFWGILSRSNRKYSSPLFEQGWMSLKRFTKSGSGVPLCWDGVAGWGRVCLQRAAGKSGLRVQPKTRP